jgi:hypothetical protein
LGEKKIVYEVDDRLVMRGKYYTRGTKTTQRLGCPRAGVQGETLAPLNRRTLLPLHHLTTAGDEPLQARARSQGRRQQGFCHVRRGRPARRGSSTSLVAAARWGARSSGGGRVWRASATSLYSGDDEIWWCAAAAGSRRRRA